MERKKFVSIHWGEVIKEIIIYQKNGKNVLEIGCGSGFLCLELARQNSMLQVLTYHQSQSSQPGL